MAGEQGMKYLEKSFTIPMGGNTVEFTPEEIAEREKLKAEREAEQEKIRLQTQEHLKNIASQKVTRKLVPWGSRILIKRRKVEDRSEHIILPDEVKGHTTDIADVIGVPDRTFCDNELLKNSEQIIKSLIQMAEDGDAQAVDSLMKFNNYLRVMSIKVGDVVLLARYGGTDFHIQETNQWLAVTDENGIYCYVKEIKQQ